MSDPLKNQSPYSGGAPAPEVLSEPPKHKLQDANLVAGGIGFTIASILTGNYGAAKKAIALGTTFKVTGRPLSIRPTLFTPLMIAAPLPIGLQKAEHSGLRENYLGRVFERDLGISRRYFIEAKMLATHPDTPEIEARFHDYMREKMTFYYERNAIDLPLAQLRSDYDLFTRAARGELGPVPIQLDVAKLAETAAELYNTKLAHLEYLNLGAIQTYINPPLAPVPLGRAPQTTVGDVAQSVLDTAALANTTVPLQPVLPPMRGTGSQRPADPSSMFQQEAADNAPRALKQNVFSRRDP